MKNPATYIRQSLLALMDGHIVYQSANVPVFGNEGKTLAFQVLIKEMNINGQNTKTSFSDTVDQVIEVISEHVSSSYKHVDAIGEQVMNRIKPQAFNNSGLASNDVFSVSGVRRTQQNYLTEVSGSGTKINRLILRFQFSITQK